MKAVKIIAISAAFLLAAVGGLMMAAAAVRGIFHTASGKRLFYEMKTFEVTEAFSDIQVEDTECSVRILRAADDTCKVVCPEKQDGSIYHTVTVSDGALRIQRHDAGKWYRYIGISFDIPDVEVYLPEQAYGKLAVHSVAGGIEVDDGFIFENASLESTSGGIRMLSEVKEELTAETASGGIAIENASPETLSAKSISGRIALCCIRSGEMTARTTAGSIELTDAVAERDLHARSVSGSVALDGCDGGSIRIETTSGSVKGTLLSDKIFVTDSTSGSVRVPRSAAGGECEITTTSGSIDIEIRP